MKASIVTVATITIITQLLMVPIFAKSGSSVIELNPRKFREEVLTSTVPFFVKFYAPWCGHCKQLAPTWESVAKNLDGVVKVGKVDCTVHQQLCGQYGVKGYPTLKLFSDKGKVSDYQQSREAKPLINFALSKLRNLVVKVDDKNQDKFWEKSRDKPHVLLFSAKSAVSNLYKSMATEYKSDLVFGQALSTNEISENLGVSKFPTLRVYMEQDSFKEYDGKFEPQQLHKFIKNYIVLEGDTDKSNNYDKSKPNRKTKEIKQFTGDKLVDYCRRKYCVVAIIDSENKGYVNDVKELMQGISDSYKKFKRFHVGYMDEKESEIFELLGIDQKPSLLIFNAKDEYHFKYRIFPSLEEKYIFSKLDVIMGGDMKFDRKEIPNPYEYEENQ
eukprot:TRINITY_DN2566_c0_g1_i1.p1 TRINITY_DN2566_c0_g1~~TRINITY_DN2566_c0_g1_i1.p1  ORF type:complete len:386 (+),score=79.28 TRINITY_DN2566_c0_g1_i1:2688-3845(+)